MSNINWSTLGVGMPSRYQESTDRYDLNVSGLEKGMDQLGNVFDRWNREKAIGKLLTQRIDAQKAVVDRLENKLSSLRSELSSAMDAQAELTRQGMEDANRMYEGEREYKSVEGPSLSQLGAQSMQGYGTKPNMFGYNPNIMVR